jgi:uncharacterized phiE125 gp8 family phage protein
MALKANALTSLATAKAQLAIKADDGTQDVRLELFINAASQRIETYTNRILKSQGTIIELQHGRSSNMILLKQYPIVSVSELNVDNSNVFGAETIVSPSDYSIGDDGNSVIARQGTFPSGYNNILVKYVAGFETVPSDLELACLWLVEWYYLHRSRGDMGRTTASKGDESVGVLDAMPPMILEILDDYRRTEMPHSSSPVRNY